jgi:ABC-type multidrug transport system ATPase subunit
VQTRSTVAIETSGLTRRFGETVAVDGISLTVEQGEAFGFLGSDGAGKSTIRNVLPGFLRPTAGETRVLRHDAVGASAAVRSRVGLLPEGYEPSGNLAGREHVQSAIRTQAAAGDSDAILDRVGLDLEDPSLETVLEQYTGDAGGEPDASAADGGERPIGDADDAGDAETAAAGAER